MQELHEVAGRIAGVERRRTVAVGLDPLLDARGFDPGRRRTALTPVPDSGAQRGVRLLVWAALGTLLAWGALRS
mgnify:CR=1 FL=1